MAPTHPQTRKPTGHRNLWYTWCPKTRDPRLATLNQRVLKYSCFSERKTKAQGQKPSVWERPPYSPPHTPTPDSNNKKLKKVSTVRMRTGPHRGSQMGPQGFGSLQEANLLGKTPAWCPHPHSPRSRMLFQSFEGPRRGRPSPCASPLASGLN